MSGETNKTPLPTTSNTSSAVKLPSQEEIDAIRSLEDEDLSWLYEPETTKGRFVRKAKENPFVPMGKRMRE